MRIFLTGATGYIGRPIVQRLLQSGHEVRILVRPDSKRNWNHPKLTIIHGDLFDTTSLLIGMEGVDAVIHLVGIIREQPRLQITMQRIHVDGTENVVQCALRSKIQRFIHMSALGAKPDTMSPYHLSKWKAEQIVRQSGITYTIFQPSVIFGKGGPGPNFIQLLIDLVKKSPIIPILGDGRFLLQPVSIQTVTEVFVKSIEEHLGENQSFEVGGPDILMYLDILKSITIHLNKRWKPIYIPFPLIKVVTKTLQNYSFYPLTMDQLFMLEEGNFCKNTERLYEVFSVEKFPFSV